MKKIVLNKLINGKEKLVKTKGISQVYSLSNGQILKLFDNEYITILKRFDPKLDIEKKILISDNLTADKRVLLPTSAVYLDNGLFVGYTIPKAKGTNFNINEENLTLEDRSNLYKYAQLHYNLEQIIKNSPDLVFPDLCSCDNIYVDSNNNIQIIDYDDHQVKNIKTPVISTSLGNQEQYLNSSKYCPNGLYTKELDIKSLVILYFLDTFNINLNKQGTIDPFTGKIITLEEILSLLNLTDYDFCHKVWKIFQEKVPNEYLGEDLYRIAERYDMDVYQNSFNNGIFIKKLRKK